jgi:glucuronosyltransferase
MSSINKDQPQTPLERAVWWTEYVIRHKGAKHLRAASLDLAWYQYLLLDVLGALLAAVTLSVYVMFVVSRCIYRLVMCKKCKAKKTVKKVMRKGAKSD